MTRRERLARCYFQHEVDRPAVFSRSGFPRNDPTYGRLKGYLAEHAELKADWPGTSFESAYPSDEYEEPYSEDFSRRVVLMHTPMGNLKRTSLESLKGRPGMHESFFINSPEDAEKYLSLPPPEIGGDPASFFEMDASMGEKGIVQAGLGLNPAGSAAELCGSQNFALMTASDRDVIHRLCLRQMEIMLSRVKFLLANSVGPFFALLGQEYIVPPMHGPEDFRDFNLRYDKPVIDCIHDAGGRVHVHCHGRIKKVIADFVEAGVDVLHPFEPPPQGDILPREAKDAVRGSICLEGNIQIHRMYEAGPGEIRGETEELIRAVFDDGAGLIVSPSASPYIRGRGEDCLMQYRAMVETVRSFRV